MFLLENTTDEFYWIYKNKFNCLNFDLFVRIFFMITILCIINLLACSGPTAPDPIPSPEGMNGPLEFHSYNTWMEEQCIQEAQRFYENLHEYLIKRGNPYGVEYFLKEYYPNLDE